MSSSDTEDSLESEDSVLLPQMTIHYSDPEFEVLHPDTVKEKMTPENTIWNWGGATIVRISPTVAVKFGTHVTLTEARSMIFVGRHTTTLPVPKIHAYYTYGPIERDLGDYGTLYDTYIFMDYVEGQTLDKFWGTYDADTKARMAAQLKGYLCELRNIANEGSSYIGSVEHGPATDHMLEKYPNKGPFESEELFNNALAEAYQKSLPKGHVKGFVAAMLHEREDHQIVFTHGDLHHRNIMANEKGEVTGIVDWELSGWYPEYWEFAKALRTWQWQNDWTDYLVQVLEPYYAENLVHSFLAKMLW